jgi:hypothetical protein
MSNSITTSKSFTTTCYYIHLLINISNYITSSKSCTTIELRGLRSELHARRFSDIFISNENRRKNYFNNDVDDFMKSNFQLEYQGAYLFIYLISLFNY